MFCENCGDKVDLNERYCNNCGHFLGNQNTNNQQNNSEMFANNVRSFNNQMMNMNYNQPNTGYQQMSNNKVNPNQIHHQYNNQINQQHQQTNKYNQLKSLAIGIGIGSLALIVIGVFYMFIFGSNVYLSSDTYEEQEVVKEQQPTRSKYKTVIVYDNKYSGVNATSEETANKLIVKDSVNQKKNCPSEIIEIENQIIKDYGITAVNLCEMDPSFAKEISKVFKRIYEEYPGTEDVLTNLTLVNATMSEGYIAAFQPIFTFATSDTDTTYPWILKTQIYLNTSYFLNEERLKASVQDGSESGHFPPNATIYSPVAHEMGHYLSFLAMMRNYNIDSILLIKDEDINNLYTLIDDFGQGNFSLKMIKEAYENYKKDKSTNLTIDEWRETISSYAVAKDNSGNYIYDETIAEAFHDVYLNKDNATDASKYIITVLKKYLKG